jgi:hypothetical protein
MANHCVLSTQGETIAYCQPRESFPCWFNVFMLLFCIGITLTHEPKRITWPTVAQGGKLGVMGRKESWIFPFYK